MLVIFSAVCWCVISGFGDSKSLSSGTSCERSFCSFVSGLQLENLGFISVCSKAARTAVGLAVFCGVWTVCCPYWDSKIPWALNDDLCQAEIKGCGAVHFGTSWDTFIKDKRGWLSYWGNRAELISLFIILVSLYCSHLWLLHWEIF